MIPDSEISIEVKAVGPTPEQHATLARAISDDLASRNLLNPGDTRLLALEWVDPLTLRERKPARPGPSRQVRATFFDYANNRALVATGAADNLTQLPVQPSGIQPRPSWEEFESAVRVVAEDPDLGRALDAGEVRPYCPMPPLVTTPLPDGTVERVITVGLLPMTENARHEIVGVNLIHRRVERFERGAPPGAMARDEICDPPPEVDGSSIRGLAGEADVTVRYRGEAIWHFRVVRPSASSGRDGSGVELRFVDYRRKRVLYRAHVPILNVRYDNDACGPFRDWQYEEATFQATGADVAPGFRLCPAPATTIMDTGSDAGNFQGVAIYVDGLEVVLVSELRAGWYRYVNEWRVHVNGTIRPRFGFAAVASSCTCNAHHHHAYWRFDFDIRTAGDNRVEEFNNPPLGITNWHTKPYEIRRPNDPARQRRWRVSNRTSGESYTLTPGAGDGSADSFGVGDVWILRYRGSEIDDAPPVDARANLDQLVDGEVVDGEDVVLWYAAHYSHTPGQHGHIVGPELTPSNW